MVNIQRIMKEHVIEYAHTATRKQLEREIKEHIERSSNEDSAMSIMRIVKIGRGKYVYYYTC